MGLFGRRHRKDPDELVEHDHLQEKMAGYLKRRQRSLADYLNQKTAKLSRTCWLVMLISFCGIAGSYLGYLLLNIFN